MQTVNYLNAPNGATYLNQFLTELPKGIFNKKTTGCGLSHLAITCDQPYIIAVPSQRLIENKVAQHTDLFGVMQGVKEKDFKAFIVKGGNKIIVTYDSLKKVVEWLSKLKINAYSEFRLLVDEYQKFLEAYSYRSDAIRSCLTHSTRFDYVTYGSATPIPAGLIPKELENLPYTEMVWPNEGKILINRKRVNKPLSAALKMIKVYATKGEYTLQGNTSRSLVVFINSVKSIKGLIDKANLKPEQVKVLCGNNERNSLILGEYFNSNPDPKDQRLITFATSAAWEGVDIYGDNAVSLAVTTVQAPHTLMSTAFAISQAAGRVRDLDNPFRNVIFHLYNTGVPNLDTPWLEANPRPSKDKYETIEDYFAAASIWKDKAKEEAINSFLSKQQEEIKEAEDLVEAFNNMKPSVKLSIAKKMIEIPHLYKFVKPVVTNNNTQFEVDEFWVKFDEYEFNLIKMIYIDGVSVLRAYKEQDFNVLTHKYQEYGSLVFDTASLGFQKAIKMYLSSKSTTEQKNIATTLFPDIEKYVETLGAGTIKTLMYCKKDIEAAYFRESKDIKSDMKSEIKYALKGRDWVPSKELKELLQSLYDSNPLWKGKKAKATDIVEFFKLSKPTSKKINGAAVKGFNIIDSHFITITTT